MDWVGLVIGTIAGGATLFFWYFLCWVVLPHHKKDFSQLPDPTALESALEESKLAPGLYCLPHVEQFDGMGDPALAERMQKGPNAFLTMCPNGPPMSPATFGRALLINLCCAGALATLFAWRPELVEGLFPTALFCGGVGVFTVFAAHLPQSNWMGVPWRVSFKHLFDDGVGYALVGVVLHFFGPGGPTAG